MQARFVQKRFHETHQSHETRRNQSGNLSRSNPPSREHEGAHIPTEHFLFVCFVVHPLSVSALASWRPASCGAPILRRTGVLKQVIPRGEPRPAVRVQEDARGRASRLDQVRPRGGTPFSNSRFLAEHHRKDPHAIFVDEFGGDQRLQQFAACPKYATRPIRCFSRRSSSHDITADALRFLPVEWSRLRVTTYFVALLNAFAIGLPPWFGQ